MKGNDYETNLYQNRCEISKINSNKSNKNTVHQAVMRKSLSSLMYGSVGGQSFKQWVTSYPFFNWLNNCSKGNPKLRSFSS